MLNVIIFGPPGSGKGTQSARIVARYGLIHVSTGDILREEMARDTPLGREVAAYIDKGLLVPDDIVIRELKEEAERHMESAGFIFDGFPRTLVQARMLDNMLGENGMPIDLVISVEVEENELFKRLVGRGEDSGRSDDSEDIIWKRIEVYKNQSHPLIDYYSKQGKLHRINGMQMVDKVFSDINTAIDSCLAERKMAEKSQ